MFASAPKIPIKIPSKSGEDTERSLEDSDRRLQAYKRKVKMREDMDLFAK